MPRVARSDAPGEVHHVWARGLERRAIFRSDEDRGDLIARLSTVLPESGLTCLGWALLPNHYHLVLKRGEVPLSRAMARIHSGYAGSFNRRYERAGFLFQNRFGSRIVASDADLVAVVRYVVRNPLKHGLCESDEQLAAYPWGSASALWGRRPAWPFESLTAIRSILEGCPEMPVPARAALAVAAPTDARDPLYAWIRRTCRTLGVEETALLTGRREREVSDARAAICWVAVTRLGLPGARVAGRLGISRSGVTRALKRGQVVCREMGLIDPA